MSILVVGSIAYDTVETPYGSAQDSPGGSALYFSAAASLFSPVNVVGVVGSDFNASKISFLKKRGVNLDGLYVESGDTFRWGGRYHKDLNKRDTLFTYLNVFEDFQPVIPEQYKDSKYIFLANIAPDLQLQVLDQIHKPKLVILDTMNFWISGKRDMLEEVFKKSDIVILNDEEVREFTNEYNLLSAIEKIHKLGPKAIVIKKGEHGAILHYEDKFFQQGPKIYNSNIDNFFKEKDISKLTQEYFNGIGLNIDDLLTKSDLYEKEGKYQHAYCIDIDRAGDVRVLCNIKPNQKWMGTMLHEFGHAVYDNYKPFKSSFYRD